jgi:hypothetical protein
LCPEHKKYSFTYLASQMLLSNCCVTVYWPGTSDQEMTMTKPLSPLA